MANRKSRTPTDIVEPKTIAPEVEQVFGRGGATDFVPAKLEHESAQNRNGEQPQAPASQANGNGHACE